MSKKKTGVQQTNRFIRAGWNCWTLGLGVGLKQQEGHYYWDNWAGYWTLTFHICIVNIQFRLWKGKKDE